MRWLADARRRQQRPEVEFKVDGDLLLEISEPVDARPVIDMFFAPTSRLPAGRASA